MKNQMATLLVAFINHRALSVSSTIGDIAYYTGERALDNWFHFV
jgi:hypothetical protein